MLRYLTNWGQRTVAVSEDIKAYLMREYGVPEEHITVTVNGIDTNKFSPEVSRDRVMAELGLDPQKPVISYVSRMDEDRPWWPVSWYRWPGIWTGKCRASSSSSRRGQCV